MAVEYKCVGAPEKGKRKRGAKTRSDRVAHAMEEIIAAEAVDGWEYLRTDLVPVEERSGMFSRSHEVHRAVLIFRRGEVAALPGRMPETRIEAPAPEPVKEAPAIAPVAPPATPQEEPRLAPREDNPAESIKLAADRAQAPDLPTLRVPEDRPKGLG